ncbi:MAG TPA: hypothetical protein VM581_02790 [Magnetospirillaceae bacterium]|nr:hypothetical protein [Magnetospirillaceae bacterium]
MSLAPEVLEPAASMGYTTCSISCLGIKVELKGQKPTTNTNRVSTPQPVRRAAEGNSFTMIQHESNKKPWVVGVIVIAVLLLGGLGWWVYGMFSDGVMRDRYQAVFLSNNQVYFGKVSNVNSDYVDLTDIYYLQVQQSVQPSDKNTNNPQVSLAKLGSELHGPEDRMRINRDQILFWENLKEDGKVVEAIKKNQEK